jgi:hypothetical protein
MIIINMSLEYGKDGFWKSSFSAGATLGGLTAVSWNRFMHHPAYHRPGLFLAFTLGSGLLF